MVKVNKMIPDLFHISIFHNTLSRLFRNVFMYIFSLCFSFSPFIRKTKKRIIKKDATTKEESATTLKLISTGF